MKQERSSKRYDFVLFDLDGTLTDSAEGILNSAEHAFRELGLEVPERSFMRQMLGPPLIWSFRELYGLPEELAQAAVLKYRERYSTVGLFENSPYDGIPELLARLKERGLRLAVATSKPEVFSVKIAERFGLMQYLETVCGSGLDGSRDTKAEVIEETLRRLGVTDRSRAVMVGDRKHDILGAKEAGLECIGVSWGFAADGELEEYGAAKIASSPEELFEILTDKETI